MAGGLGSRSREEPKSSPWRWWNAGRANRGRPACASFPCIPSSLSRFSSLSHLFTPPLSILLSLSVCPLAHAVPFFPRILSLAPRFSHTNAFISVRSVSRYSSPLVSPFNARRTMYEHTRNRPRIGTRTSFSFVGPPFASSCL